MLVSVATYREITGDTDSATARVETALEEAEALLVDELGRGLETATVTERLLVDSYGRVFPTRTPVTAATGLTVASTAMLEDASPDGGPFSSTEHATVSYTGGLDPDETDPTAATFVPRYMRRDIAWAAYHLLRPADALSMPAGATSVRLGDAAITGKASAPSTNGVVWSRQTLRWRVRRPR